MEIAGYATRLLRLDLGSLDLDVRVVDGLEDYVDGAALLRDAGAPEPPYWMHLWAAERCLARLVAARGDWRRRAVVEIACGLGAAGIAAARRGAAVTVFDTSVASLRFARANAELNGCRVEAVQTDLRQPGLGAAFDVCLAADATYDPSLQAAMAAFLASHLGPAGWAWVADSVRSCDPGFGAACRRAGLAVRETQIGETDEGAPSWVRLTEVRRR